MDNLNGIRTWRTWRVAETEDGTAVQAGLGPDDYPSANVISVHPYTQIALRAYGADTDNDDATVRITGWMDNITPTGPGPGQILFHSEIIIGATNFNERPVADGRWPSATAWFEVDDWVTGVIENAAIAYLRTAGASTILLLPTLGYTNLWLEIINLGAATEMTKLGVLWRPVSKEWPHIA